MKQPVKVKRGLEICAEESRRRRDNFAGV